jgi:hypothetical protein
LVRRARQQQTSGVVTAPEEKSSIPYLELNFKTSFTNGVWKIINHKNQKDFDSPILVFHQSTLIIDFLVVTSLFQINISHLTKKRIAINLFLI